MHPYNVFLVCPVTNWASLGVFKFDSIVSSIHLCCVFRPGWNKFLALKQLFGWFYFVFFAIKQLLDLYLIIIVMKTNYTLNFLFSPFIFVFNLLYLLVGSNMSPVQFIYLLKQTKEQFPLQRVKGGDSISLKKVKLVNKHKATTLHFSFLSSSFLLLIYYLFLFLVFS